MAVAKTDAIRWLVPKVPADGEHYTLKRLGANQATTITCLSTWADTFGSTDVNEAAILSSQSCWEAVRSLNACF